MPKKPLSDKNGDVRELTKTDFRDMRSLKKDRPDIVAALKRGPGRPKAESPKKQITLRLDPAIIDHFKSEGKGWQSRMNEALKEYVETHK